MVGSRNPARSRRFLRRGRSAEPARRGAAAPARRGRWTLRRSPSRAVVRGVALLVASGLMSALAQSSPPENYELPGDAVFPEGIALDAEGGFFYVGSTSDGTIFRVALADGTVEEFVPAGAGPFTTIGLAFDPQGRLWVAGGGSGAVRVYATEDGSLLATLETPPADNTFLNDVALAPDGSAYITDSRRPVVFRVPPDLSAIEAWLDLTGTAFAYQEEGTNANGIVVTSDGQHLIVVQSNTGALFRIALADGAVAPIALTDEAGAVSVDNGDGLVLDGSTLYVVRNRDARIDVIELAPDAASGTRTGSLTDDDLAFPTTARLDGSDLLVVNAQFDARESPVLPFTVSRVPTQ